MASTQLHSYHVFGVWFSECSSVVSLPSGRSLASLAGRSILVWGSSAGDGGVAGDAIAGKPLMDEPAG